MKLILTVIGAVCITLTVFLPSAFAASCNEKFPGDTGYLTECAAAQGGEMEAPVSKGTVSTGLPVTPGQLIPV